MLYLFFYRIVQATNTSRIRFTILSTFLGSVCQPINQPFVSQSIYHNCIFVSSRIKTLVPGTTAYRIRSTTLYVFLGSVCHPINQSKNFQLIDVICFCVSSTICRIRSTTTTLSVISGSFYQSPNKSIINPFHYFAESESDSDLEQQEPLSKEEEDQLLQSDTDTMDVDNESFHSATSVQGDNASCGGQLALSRVFNTVLLAKLASMATRSLISAGTRPLSPVGSLVDPGDGRCTRSFTISSFSKQRNIMASFDMETLKCATCPLKPGHIVLYKEANEQMNMYHFPAVIIVSDPSFPANIPTGGEGECLKIIRVEDSQLDELAAVFLETTRPFSLPAGLVVLLHSLSHLAWVGAAAYAEDFVRCRQRICGIYKSGLSVIHGIPILQEGSKLHTLISDLSIVYDWYNTVRHTAERDILKTRKIVYNLISAASPMAAVDRGEPMAARLSTMPMAPSTPGQPMAPGSPRRDGSGSLWLCFRLNQSPVSRWLRISVVAMALVSLWLQLPMVQVVRLWRRRPVRR